MKQACCSCRPEVLAGRSTADKKKIPEPRTRLRERETDLAQSRRQIVDLTNQFDQPFEHEEKLAVATKRQQEIVAALDITKNQASSTIGQDGLQQECEGLEAKPNQNVREAIRHGRSHAVVTKS